MAGDRNACAELPCSRVLWQAGIRHLIRRAQPADTALAPRRLFFYASRVKTSVSLLSPSVLSRRIRVLSFVAAALAFCSSTLFGQAEPPPKQDANAPVV